MTPRRPETTPHQRLNGSNLLVSGLFANSLTTGGVFAATANLHHARPFSILAVFAAILAAFLGRTITSSMRTLA
jgi:hypothetical protein